MKRFAGFIFCWTLSATISLPGQFDDSSESQRRRTNEVFLVDDLLTKTASERVEFPTDTKFASKASEIVGRYRPRVTNRTPEKIAAVANRFLATLSDAQQETVTEDLNSAERGAWTNLPARPGAGGIRLGKLDESQVKAACDLIAHLLSPVGYEKMRLIMLADDQLLRNGQARPGFGTEYFSVVIFGTPSSKDLWAFQLDGHHVGLNVAMMGNKLTIAPSFIGTQPVEFKLGGQSIRPLKHEVESAFRLANDLDADQFKTATVAKKRGQIRTGPGRDGRRLDANGIHCEAFNKQQRESLLQLIYAWVSNLPDEQANQRMLQVTSEIDQMYFSWSGFRKPGSDVSYTIQSPSLIIEFAYQDLGGDPLNHLHTQYRNLNNDYGKAFISKNRLP